MPGGLKRTMAAAVAGGIARRPDLLRRELRHGKDKELTRRRLIVAVSMAGIASMSPVTFYQTGMIRHLPDPPVRGFDSDKVNGSETAFGYGGPDAPISLLGHAVNLLLAAFGGADRARSRRWLPVMAALAAGSQASVATRYLFYQMPRVDRAWCPYCITDALTHIATFALTLPEAVRALRR